MQNSPDEDELISNQFTRLFQVIIIKIHPIITLPPRQATMTTASSQPCDDLATMSKRIKSNPNLITQLNEFHQSTRPNQNQLKMINLPPSTYSHESPIIHSLSSPPAPTNNPQVKAQPLYQLERKTPFKQDFPFCRLILKLFAITFIVLFVVDFYSQLQDERQRKTNQIAKCYQDYVENNCASPLQALIDECQRLEFCASRDPIKVAKASDVFINSIIGLFVKATHQLTYIGVVFIVLLGLVYLYRPAMYHEQKIHKFE